MRYVKSNKQSTHPLSCKLDRRMKLSSRHFIVEQDFVTDSVRDAIALQTTDLNYGLQPVAGDSVKRHVLMDHFWVGCS